MIWNYSFNELKNKQNNKGGNLISMMNRTILLKADKQREKFNCLNNY